MTAASHHLLWRALRPARVSEVRLAPLSASGDATMPPVTPGASGYEGFFGEDVAASYDAGAAEMFDPAVVDPVVDLLARLAGTGRALELAIGTGRIALPLAARGVPVAGIDDSEAMVARLRAKPGGEEIEVAIGDFATTRVPGEFAVVYLVFNTIFNLVTQDAQVACFETPPRTSRREALRRRDARPGAAAAPAGPDDPPVPRRPGRALVRRLRRRHAAVQLAALPLLRAGRAGDTGRAPLRLARGARPHGAHRRALAGGALRRLAQ